MQTHTPHRSEQQRRKGRCSCSHLPLYPARLWYLLLRGRNRQQRPEGVSHSMVSCVRCHLTNPKQSGISASGACATCISRQPDYTFSPSFATRDVRLSRLPGWEKNSWGYHGDDGYSFAAERNGTPYGPTYGSKSVMTIDSLRVMYASHPQRETSSAVESTLANTRFFTPRTAPS